MEKKRAVVSVIGKDAVGIIAKVTSTLANNNINILDISQTILNEFFTMMMIIDVTDNENIDKLRDEFDMIGKDLGVKINIQHEEIFQSMHRV